MRANRHIGKYLCEIQSQLNYISSLCCFIKKQKFDNDKVLYVEVSSKKYLKRVVEQRKFSYSEKVNDALKEYETENNPVLMFLDEVGQAGIENQLTDEVYRRYKVFCIENGYSEMTKTTFSKEVNRKLGLITKLRKIDGKVFRIYMKSEEKVTEGNRR